MNTSLNLFDSVPPDILNFGRGSSFKPKQVPDFLKLKNADVSRIASVAASSVRYDEAIPEQLKFRLEEIASTINLVAKFFNSDIEKTATWFTTRNPLLGDVSPRDMIRLGRYERLRKFIISAMMEQAGNQKKNQS